jgi:hypothetical protein
MKTPPARSWLDPRVEVRPSPIHGLGMFAQEPIREGEVVIRWGGTVMPLAALDELKERDRYDCAALSESTIIVFALDDPVIYGNHACDGALWLEDELTMTARRDIGVGEEITVDYAILSDDPEWEEACRCGSGLCRGVMRGDDWRLPEVQERYQGHFAPYLNQRIIAASRNR